MIEVNTDKPCPFCGNKVIQTTVDDGCHWRSCPKCSATGPTEFLRSDEDSPGWNTRPDFDAQRLRADTAEAELKVVRKSRDDELENYNALISELAAAEQSIAKLEALLDTPHTADWFEGVKLEAGHQIRRWGSDRDTGKAPADWFWLIGYLAQKAMTSQMLGNEEKAKHHTISTGAALLNWFRAITGDSDAMRPGIDGAALNPNPEAESHE